MSRVKIAEELVFLFFFSEFFQFLRKNFSYFWPKVFKKLSKLPSACADEHFLAWRNFQKFWTVLDFLQKPLAWFSKFYLRGQSKICGRNILFNCSFQNFFQFSSKYFQTFGQKTSRSCQNYLPRVQMNKFWLEKFFFKNFEPFWIFWRTLAWFSNFYLRVQSKNFGRISFFCFSSQIFFRILRKNFSNFWPKVFKKLSKLPSACADEQFLAGRNLQKFWTVLDFLQKPLAWFSKFYQRVQSKSCRRNSFFFFSDVFSDVEQKKFQTCGQKTSKSCQNYLLRVQRNNLWLEFF